MAPSLMRVARPVRLASCREPARECKPARALALAPRSGGRVDSEAMAARAPATSTGTRRGDAGAAPLDRARLAALIAAVAGALLVRRVRRAPPAASGIFELSAVALARCVEGELKRQTEPPTRSRPSSTSGPTRSTAGSRCCAGATRKRGRRHSSSRCWSCASRRRAGSRPSPSCASRRRAGAAITRGGLGGASVAARRRRREGCGPRYARPGGCRLSGSAARRFSVAAPRGAQPARRRALSPVAPRPCFTVQHAAHRCVARAGTWRAHRRAAARCARRPRRIGGARASPTRWGSSGTPSSGAGPASASSRSSSTGALHAAAVAVAEETVRLLAGLVAGGWTTIPAEAGRERLPPRRHAPRRGLRGPRATPPRS